MAFEDRVAIPVEQIRPQYCPLGKDNCVCCKYILDVWFNWNDCYIECGYKEERVV